MQAYQMICCVLNYRFKPFDAYLTSNPKTRAPTQILVNTDRESIIALLRKPRDKQLSSSKTNIKQELHSDKSSSPLQASSPEGKKEDVLLEEVWEDIDVSECLSSDLLDCVDGGFNPKTSSFEFNHRFGALIRALDKGKRILLHGKFSHELADKLAPFLNERQKAKSAAKGELILIPDDPKQFEYRFA